MSFAKFNVWINTSNVERTASPPFGRWDDAEAIVEVRGRFERRRWDRGCDEESDV